MWRTPQYFTRSCLLVAAASLCLTNDLTAQEAPAPKPLHAFVKKCFTDKLLKPPFAEAPEGSLKALAAEIRESELDVRNRIRAVRYLGTVDCVAFPEARQMLIKTMQTDPFEPVRYEAVMALSMMLTRGAENQDNCECNYCRQANEDTNDCADEAQRYSRRRARPAYGRRAGIEEDQRYDYCLGCCNAETLEALAEVAYGRRDDGCWIEPSERVRLAAECALKICPCQPYVKTIPLPIPDGTDKRQEGTIPEKEKEEENGNSTDEPAPLPGAEEVGIPSLSRQQPLGGSEGPALSLTAYSLGEYKQLFQNQPIEVLSRHCLVGLKNHQFIEADPRFRVTYRDRVYYFADAQAMVKFHQSPDKYAPAFSGLDPVAYVNRGEYVEGRYLREYQGRFYLFSTKETWEEFKKSPHLYANDAN